MYDSGIRSSSSSSCFPSSCRGEDRDIISSEPLKMPGIKFQTFFTRKLFHFLLRKGCRLVFSPHHYSNCCCYWSSNIKFLISSFSPPSFLCQSRLEYSIAVVSHIGKSTIQRKRCKCFQLKLHFQYTNVKICSPNYKSQCQRQEINIYPIKRPVKNTPNFQDSIISLFDKFFCQGVGGCNIRR